MAANNRIIELFKNKRNNILSVYYTAGFPTLNDTDPIAVALERAGADIIEIGIPFSDPVADGPTIQQSNKVALDNGMTLTLLFNQVKDIRSAVKVPIILMGYLNPVMQYGIEKFVSDCSSLGVDGVIIPDLPIQEYEEHFEDAFARANLCNTFLISPTTSEERIRRIDSLTRGFIYAVSASSTTGAKGSFSIEQVEYFQRVQKMNLKNPFLIGFGISDSTTFSSACKYGAGAIVGSAFINILHRTQNLSEDINAFVNSIRGQAQNRPFI